MKLTAKQTRTKTLAGLYRALQHGWAVTITYTDRHGETTVRTVEPFELSTTQNGDIRLHTMCRLAHAENPDDAERAFTVHRISAYTVHRMAFVLTRPEPTTYERPEPQPVNDEQALFFYELARDRDDADYCPRVKLAQTDTDLAA